MPRNSDNAGSSSHDRGNYSADTTTGGNCCAECICNMFRIVLSSCCIGRLTRAKRIQVLWIWILFTSLCLGLGYFYRNYSQQETEASPWDMRMTDRGYSALMCEGVSFASHNYFTAFLFDKPPLIDKYARKMYTFSREITIDYSGHPLMWNFYLLTGSHVKIENHFTSCVMVYIFKGSDSFEKWNKNGCMNCYTQIYTIYQQSFDIMYNIDETDTYYIVFRQCQHSDVVKGKVTFIVNRTVYNTDGAVSSCLHPDYCYFELDMGKNQVVAWQVESWNFANGEHGQILSLCHCRIYVLLLLFLFSPLIVGLVISLAICVLCKDPPHPDRPPTDRPGVPWDAFYPYAPTERTPLFGNDTVPPYTETLFPPKYENIIRGRTPPPPYQEVVSSPVINSSSSRTDAVEEA